METTHINMSKARGNMKTLVQQVSSTGTPVVVDNRNQPAVILVPYNIYKTIALNAPKYSEYMAIMFARKFLSDAPTHMLESQIKEFGKLSAVQLCAFIEIESLPIPPEIREKLIKSVGVEVVERLEKRREIADAVNKARQEGLYELEEHKTGMLEL